MRHTFWRAPAALVVVTGLLTLGQGTAIADDDPLGDLGSTVHQQLDPVTKPLKKAVTPRAGTSKSAPKAGASTPSHDPGAPSSKDTTGGNDVEDPSAPDHAGADALKSQAGGQDLVGVGNNNSTVEDDDSTRSDGTLLAVGGMEVAGSHADSRGQQQDTFDPAGDATTPVCDGSSGQLCLDVLYAGSSATDDGTTSRSSSDSQLAGACAGGTDTGVVTSTDCEAPVKVGLGGSTTDAQRNQATGRTTASSSSSLAMVCLSPPTGLPDAPQVPAVTLPQVPMLPDLPTLPSLPVGGTGCALGGSVLESHGTSDSGGDHPTATRGSSVGALEVGGTKQEIGDSQAAEVPPGCPVPAGGATLPTDPAQASIACAYVNQGQTYLGPDSTAGHAQEALKLRLLPSLLNGDDLLTLIGARTETLVHNDGGETTPVVKGVEATSPRTHARPAAVLAGVESGSTGGLPNTGGPSEALLAGGLLALGAGAMLVAVSRLRRFGLTSI